MFPRTRFKVEGFDCGFNFTKPTFLPRYSDQVSLLFNRLLTLSSVPGKILEGLWVQYRDFITTNINIGHSWCELVINNQVRTYNSTFPLYLKPSFSLKKDFNLSLSTSSTISQWESTCMENYCHQRYQSQSNDAFLSILILTNIIFMFRTNLWRGYSWIRENFLILN